MPIATLTDIKAHLNITGTSHDTELQTFLDAYTQVVIGIVGAVDSTAYDEFYDGGGPFIDLRHRPVLSITSVVEYRGPIPYTLTAVTTPDAGTTYSYLVELAGGRIVRRTVGGGVTNFPPGLQAVRVQYTAGDASVPANVKLGLCELVRENYQQTQQGGRPQYGAPAAAETLGVEVGSVVISDRVRTLLEPHERHPSVA